MNCRVSVIVPVYNVEKYLKQCLDSLINQTLEDIEIICVNDGSTDSSLNILEEYQNKDNRIKIISQENKGVSAARNLGLKNAKGEYLLFIDADDWVELNALEELFNYSKKLNSEILFFTFKQFYESSSTYEVNDSINLKLLDSTFENKVFTYKDTVDFLFKIPHAVYNKFYNLSFLRKINAEFIGNLGEDMLFHYKTFLKASKVSVIHKSYYNYRIRDGSACTSGGKASFNIFETLKGLQDLLIEMNIYNQFKQEFFEFIIINIKFVYLRLLDDNKEEFFNLLKEKYWEFNLNQVDEYLNEWHFDDRVFYQSIAQSNNASQFDLLYKKLYDEFLANMSKQESNKKSLKSKLKRLLKS